jgi:GNAT superfamily N-acetyltransferase
LPIDYLRNAPITNQALNELRAAAWDEVGDQDWNETVFKHSLGWVGAFDGERLVGFVNVAWDGGAHAFLLDTTVHPDYQHRGIGLKLVEEAADLARERDCEWLHVDFDPELEPFYRRAGFQPAPAGLIYLPR